VQDEVNQDYSEQNEVDGMKKGAEFAYCANDVTVDVMSYPTCLLSL